MNKSRRFVWIAFSGSLVLVLFQIIVNYAKLPSLMATHFDASGYPDGYMDRGSFIFVYFALLAIMAVSFGVVSYIFPRILDIATLPNKDFWIQQENREYTVHAFVVNYLSLGVVTMILFIHIFQSVVNFNMYGITKMNRIWPELIVYFVIVLFIVINLFRSYSKKAMVKVNRDMQGTDAG